MGEARFEDDEGIGKSTRGLPLNRLARWLTALAGSAGALSLLGWSVHERVHGFPGALLDVAAVVASALQILPLVLGVALLLATRAPTLRPRAGRMLKGAFWLQALLVVSSVAFGSTWFVMGAVDYLGCERSQQRLVDACFHARRGESCRELAERRLVTACSGGVDRADLLGYYRAGCEAEDAVSCERARILGQELEAACADCSEEGEACVLLGRHRESWSEDGEARRRFGEACKCGSLWACGHLEWLDEPSSASHDTGAR